MAAKHADRGQAHFDRWASSYDRSLHQRLTFEPIHRAVLKAYDACGPAPRDVLDVGCGTGRLLEAAGRRWADARLTGVDASEQMLAQARRKGEGDPRLTFERGDASALPLPDASIDAAFSTMSFHHWADREGGVREVLRVLRPGGIFILADIKMPLLVLLRPVVNRGDRATFERPGIVRGYLERAPFAILMQKKSWLPTPAYLFVARKR